MRSRDVTATARILPSCISGSAAARLEKLIVTAPVATSVTAGAEPRYGTCSTLMPAMLFINSPASCCGLPTPDDENDSLPAFALAYSTSVFGSLTGDSAFTTTTHGTIPTNEIGTSSLPGR